MAPRNLYVAIAMVAAVLAGAYLANRLQPPAAPNTAMILPDPDPVPAFSLVDQYGNDIDESVFRGQWDLVFFGFTHCPDICPMTLQVLAAARQQLADAGEETLPRIVLVSVDPERDTPELMGRYVGYFGEGNLGITGTVEGIRQLTDGLGIYFKKQPSDGENYNVDHSAAVLAIDPDGRFHALFSGPHVIENYVNDLPIVMAGS